MVRVRSYKKRCEAGDRISFNLSKLSPSETNNPRAGRDMVIVGRIRSRNIGSLGIPWYDVEDNLGYKYSVREEYARRS